MGRRGRGQCSFSLDRQNPDTLNDYHNDDDDDNDVDDNDDDDEADHPDGAEMEGKDDHHCRVPVAEGGKNLSNSYHIHKQDLPLYIDRAKTFFSILHCRVIVIAKTIIVVKIMICIAIVIVCGIVLLIFSCLRYCRYHCFPW